MAEQATHTYEQLKHMTVAQLRDIAKGNEHEALQGYSQLNKDHLIVALCKALNIGHEHHEAIGIDKAAIKQQIKTLKQQRSEALGARDHARLKALRRQIHNLNHRIRRATV